MHVFIIWSVVKIDFLVCEMYRYASYHIVWTVCIYCPNGLFFRNRKTKTMPAVYHTAGIVLKADFVIVIF